VEREALLLQFWKGGLTEDGLEKASGPGDEKPNLGLLEERGRLGGQE